MPDTPAPDILDQLDVANGRTAALTVRGVALNPAERAAQYDTAARTLGLPIAAVEADPATASARIAAQTAVASLPGAPRTAAWLTDPDNAAVSHDRVAQLSGIERLWQGVRDTGQDWMARIVGTTGQTAGGVFNLTDLLGGQLASGSTGRTQSGQDFMVDPGALMGGGAPRFIPITPQTAAENQAMGRGEIRPGGQAIAPVVAGAHAFEGRNALANPNLFQRVSGGVVGSLPLLAAAILNPLLGGLAFGASGAGQAGEEADAAHATPEQRQQAVAGNAVIQGALGSIPAEGILARFLPRLAVPGGRVLRSVLASGAGNAALGASMAVGSNVVASQTFDPNRPLAQGAGQGALDMALAGLVIHGATHLPGAIRGALGDTVNARASASSVAALNAAAEAVRDEPLATRSPERFQALMAAVTGGDNVFMPAAAVREFMQAKMSPQEQVDFVTATGIGEQLATAHGPAADIVIPADAYLAHVAPTPLHDALADHIRTTADGMTADEARQFEEHYAEFLTAKGDDLHQAAAAEEARAGPGNRVFDDVREQAVTAGITPEAARQYAALFASRYESRAARLGTDAWAEYQAAGTGQGVSIQREVAPELRARFEALDPVIDAVRKGSSGRAEPSLLEFLARSGGMQDAGGELQALGAHEFHQGKPFMPRLVRDKGRSLDEAAQAAADAGYLGPRDTRQRSEAPAPTQGELLAAVEREMRGERIVPDTADPRRGEFRRAVDDLEQLLGSLGIDPAKASNAEIKAAVERYASEGGRSFDQPSRGNITFGDGEAVIRLFKGSDLSTLLHEGGHLFFEEMQADAGRAGGQLADDLAATRRWLGLEDGQAVDTAHHEQFARGFEAYLMEGRAPSTALRAVFQRFKAWLTNIYRNLTGLDVHVSPEMRQVFDRLVASDDEIAAAEKRDSLNPIFADPEAGGMTAVEYADYTKALNDSNATARETLLTRLMRDIRRQRTKEWADERRALREKVAAEIDAHPDVRAYHYLARGELLGVPEGEQPGQHKINRDLAEVGVFGAEGVPDRLPRGATVKEGGVHPDMLAELTGHASGEAMLRGVMALESERRALAEQGIRTPLRKRLTDAETDRQMIARHGDSLHDGTIEQEAEDALHNDERMRLVAIEVRALGKGSPDGQAQWSGDVLKRYAEHAMSMRKVGEVRPAQFLRAERQAGIEAQRLLLAGDKVGALERKRQQLINMHLFRAATDAREAILAAARLFDRIAGGRDADIAQRRNMDLVQAARAILTAHGVGRARGNASDYLEAVKAYNPDLYNDIASRVEAAVADGRPIKDLPYETMLGLRDTVEQLWRQSRVEKTVEIDGRRVAKEEAIEPLVARLDALGVAKAPILSRDPTKLDRTMRGIQGMVAAGTRVEHWVTLMDGGANGPFRRYIWNRISEGATTLRQRETQVMQQWADVVGRYSHLFKGGKIDAREIGYVFGSDNGGSGKVSLLHALGHMGNSSNAFKLLVGRGWGRALEGGGVDRSRWDAFLERAHREGTLTKDDWDFVQAMWTITEGLKPAAQATHRQAFGRYFDEVTAEPVQTPFGEYKGGYLPAVTDDLLAQDAAQRADADSILSAGDASMFPSTPKGFTKTRDERYAKPLSLDVGLMPSHFSKVLRFTHMTMPVRDALQILRAPEFTKKLEAHDPVALSEMLLPWLNRSAKQITETPMLGAGGRLFTKVANTIRSRTGMNIMVGNISNAAQQFTGLFPALLRAKPGRVMGALARYVRGPGSMAEEASSLSPFMASHLDASSFEISRNLRELLLNPNTYERAREFAQKHAYVLQRGTQNIVDTVVWHAVHEEAIATKAGDVEAVRRADAAIRETQGSMAPEDVSRWETGNAIVRNLTQFYSYFGNQANLLGTDFHIANRDLRGSARARRHLYVYAVGFAMPAIVSGLIQKAFSGDFNDDSEGATARNVLDVLFGSQIRYGLGMVPVAGPTLNAAINRFDDKAFNDRVQTAPAISTLEGVAGVPHDIWHTLLNPETRGTGQRALVRDSMTLTTLITGIPLGLVQRPAGYLADIHEGKVMPTGPVDLVRGLITGTASPASRH